MQEVIFIIGLPGSGKSTLIEHYKTHRFIDYKLYSDWMTRTHDDREKGICFLLKLPRITSKFKTRS